MSMHRGTMRVRCSSSSWGGTAIVSTPYHGYWKNLALAVTGRMDAHFTALWDHGHIKFWSIATLGELLREAGFVDIRFERLGRVPALAKSMIAVAKRPAQNPVYASLHPSDIPTHGQDEGCA